MLGSCVVWAGNISDLFHGPKNVIQFAILYHCVSPWTLRHFTVYRLCVRVWVCVTPTFAYDYCLWKSQNSNKQTRQSQSYLNGILDPINLFASDENPPQILFFFCTFCISFLFFLTDCGFVCDRVEKQVSVCSVCIIRTNWLNPARRKCGNMSPTCHPLPPHS